MRARLLLQVKAFYCCECCFFDPGNNWCRLWNEPCPPDREASWCRFFRYALRPRVVRTW